MKIVTVYPIQGAEDLAHNQGKMLPFYASGSAGTSCCSLRKCYLFLLALIAGSALLLSCTAELIPPPKQPEIEIISPFKYNGTKAYLRDTLIGPRGTAYKFKVRFITNNSPMAINPSVTFDGSGSGSTPKDIIPNQEVELYYRPDSEGYHPVMLYWANHTCAFLPEQVVNIRLFVQYQPSDK